jgi:hypothetical protein
MEVCDTGDMSTLVAAMLPSSPRRRRLLLRFALALVALAAAAGAFTLLPGAPKPPPERFSNEPAQLYDSSAVKTTVSRADRRAIDHTLERFVEDAMGRRDLISAYHLSSPALRNGQTLAQWRRGEIPVYPYTARPGSSRGWELKFREDDLAALEVFLYPGQGESNGPITLAVDMRRIGGRWLVEGVAPTAVFSKPGEKARVIANTDFTRGDVSRPESRLDPRWLLAIPGAIFAMLLGVVLVVVLRRGRTSLG